MLSVHACIILSELILTSFTLGQNCPFIECPPEWRMWRRGCYRSTPDLSWADAKEYCQAMGGDMAAPRSQEENDFFNSYIDKQNSLSKIWLACDDRDVEGEWMCNNIQHTDTFTDWQNEEPNQYGDEDCGAMANWAGKKWVDVPCTREHPAICYRKPITLS